MIELLNYISDNTTRDEFNEILNMVTMISNSIILVLGNLLILKS